MDSEELRDLLDKATPGLWIWGNERSEWPACELVAADGDSPMWWDFDLGFRFEHKANATLIAAAPDLAAEVLALRAEVERLRYVLEGVRGAIKTERNEPLAIWAEQIDIALTTKGGA